MRKIKKANNLYFEEIETDIIKKEKFVQEQIRKEKDIYDSYLLLREYKKVLQLSKEMIISSGRQNLAQTSNTSLNYSVTKEEETKNDNNRALLTQDNMENQISVGTLVGTIRRHEKDQFKRLIFRATRGNALAHFRDFDAPMFDYYGNQIFKTVYVVMFPDGAAIKNKLSKICDSFMGEKYDIPSSDIDDKINEVNQKIKETKNIVNITKKELHKYLVSINSLEGSDVSALQVTKWYVIKERSLFSAMNKLRIGDRLLVGLFWLPNSKIDEMNVKISDIREDRNISGPQIWKRENHTIKPPTFFRLNEFTSSFQDITNTYGVPDYKEVNPSIFAIVTFPFLFGVMFGDIGHGTLLFLFGAFLCLMNEKLKGTSLAAMATARYLIVLMGVFAIFNGICYNDFMSLPLDISTCWDIITRDGQRVGVLTDN
jgi:V-type H+-transporting ATPase subunit a